MAGTSFSVLGINGLGRIGKLTLWHHAARKDFREIVINIGRSAGTSFEDTVDYVLHDSTYGSLERYLFGARGGNVVEGLNDTDRTVVINGVKVRFLLESRNPADIDWMGRGVALVVDTTGCFIDPTHEADRIGGSVRGHIQAGACTVIVSAPFKIKDKARTMPDDAVTAIMGINEAAFDPSCHRIISAASCTTTCLAHMMKPLLDSIGATRILSASMATVHAATGTQNVLDRLPQPGATDLRKNRAVMNNIILTTTGAAKTLALVLPDMKKIGFMAESVRIPVPSGSLVILVVNIQEDPSGEVLKKERIKEIYRQAAGSMPGGYLIFSEKQRVSADIMAMPAAGAIIEGSEIHTRTAEITLDAGMLRGPKGLLPPDAGEIDIAVPLTQAVVYGWYDNELGGYVHMLGELTRYVAASMELV